MYLSSNNLFPVYQSAYRHHHSTETALLKVVNDILLNMDKQHVTLLLFLDLSAAFDTVEHDTLLRRLQNSFGIQGKVLSSLRALSRIFNLECGVPQGSCLGPLLFTLYTSRQFDIILTHLPKVHCFADDTQLYLSSVPVIQSTSYLPSVLWNLVLMIFVHGC